ncbi:MAG: Thiamin-phosphate pyrophosphorylase [Acidimicrobiales bacterium]|nr:Thiamin-phosphate pyrophosphorylase [Acidimicrobiales bacterium]
MTAPADRLAGRRLYLCTPDRPDLERFVAACLAGGVDLVQLREKHLDARPLLGRARLALGVCRDHGVPFIVNDRPDLALECGADGVHVGQDDAPPELARRVLGPDAIVGRSTHAPDELARANTEPVDYVSVGPVRPTPTKPGRPGTGLGYLRHAAAESRQPWFVTGGAAPDTVAAMVAAGARRFVAVRWLTEAADPEGAARALARAIDDAIASAAPVP